MWGLAIVKEVVCYNFFMLNTTLIQRIEGLVIFVAITYFYFGYGFSLLWYLVFLLSFDISMMGYLRDAVLGAYIYNIVHSFVLPVLFLLFGFIFGWQVVIGFSLIWLAHISLDRAFGYGLKKKSGFNHTHLGSFGGK